MNYEMIDRIMAQKSLATDPAFGDELHIAIQPTPNLNGCPLGLYFPDPPATIVLPPDALEGVLLHELGHRHGHFYYQDLSEKYAEDFRKIYQRGRALLYLGPDFARLPKFGRIFEEGERGAVEIALLQPLTPDELYYFKSQLSSYGERPPEVYLGNSELPWVRVEFTKGVDWIAIIGSILAGTTLAGVGALGYAVYKTAEASPWVVPFALFGVVSALLLRAAIRQEKVKARIPI